MFENISFSIVSCMKHSTVLNFRPLLDKRSISPSRKTREKLKAVDSDLETEIEEVSLIVKLGQLPHSECRSVASQGTSL